jgi:hypothetical protein
MRSTPSFATLLQRFFTERLMQQRQASPHTISSRERSSNVSCGRSKAMNPFWTMVSYLQRPVHHLATNNVSQALVQATLAQDYPSRTLIVPLKPRRNSFALTIARLEVCYFFTNRRTFISATQLA